MSAPLDQAMTAAEYVALAKRAAPKILSHPLLANDVKFGYVLCVGERGGISRLGAPHGVKRSVFALKMTPENTASEDALVRALLASLCNCPEGSVKTTPPHYLHCPAGDALDTLLAAPHGLLDHGDR